jgi:hypothetical protein
MVRRILRKYGYPPDKQEKATLTVLEQAELLCGVMVSEIIGMNKKMLFVISHSGMLRI